MIVKNEEKVIARCLESVSQIADEIIVVDTGSTDNTKKICRKYTDKVYDFEWIYDFSAARNFSYSKATKDYVLWMDADDIITEEDRVKFIGLKQCLDPAVDVVMMKYNTGFDEYGNVTLSYFRERLSKRANSYKWHEPVHEYLDKSGIIINSDICVTHKKMEISTPGRNISIYERVIKGGGSLSPRGLYYYARELYYVGRFDEAIEHFNRFLDTKLGWIEDNISACYLLSICYSNRGDKENMLRASLRSFECSTPRAEICCQIGYCFFSSKDYEKAAFWYRLATNLEKPSESWGFISHDYWGYIPYIQLCVCYDKLGKTEEAIRCNDKAAEFKPNDPAVLYNKRYFEGLKRVW